jgi:hypothetical protein
VICQVLPSGRYPSNTRNGSTIFNMAVDLIITGVEGISEDFIITGGV